MQQRFCKTWISSFAAFFIITITTRTNTLVQTKELPNVGQVAQLNPSKIFELNEGYYDDGEDEMEDDSEEMLMKKKKN